METTDTSSRSSFGRYLESNIEIDSESIDRLVRNCRRIEVKRGEFALRQGMTCRHAFFVEKGLLKEYSVDEKGREHVLLFAPENWFTSNVETLFFRMPSSFFVEAIEDSSILLIDQGTLDMLERSYPAFSDFNQRLLHAHVRELERRVGQLMGASAEERYLDFMARYPSLFQRIPQVEIAAYLGIAPESLSRVRRELAQHKFKPTP
jgi:CRP-like cAMP-binding protein